MTPAFTHHVVPVDWDIVHGIYCGLCCVRCRKQFEVYLWPRDQMMVSCLCKCVCHQKAAA